MIYFIQANGNGPIKIGYTDNDIKERLLALQTSSPYKLKVLAVMQGSMDAEQMLHELFSKYRLEGEWFSPNEVLIDFIKTNASNEIQKFITEEHIKYIKKGLRNRLIGRNRIDLKNVIHSIEREIIIEALKINDWRKSKTARFLNVNKSNFSQKLKSFNIIKPNESNSDL